jgi:hypothetical protein
VRNLCYVIAADAGTKKISQAMPSEPISDRTATILIKRLFARRFAEIQAVNGRSEGATINGQMTAFLK